LNRTNWIWKKTSATKIWVTIGRLCKLGRRVGILGVVGSTHHGEGGGDEERDEKGANVEKHILNV
jgi:hypothetical protein